MHMRRCAIGASLFIGGILATPGLAQTSPIQAYNLDWSISSGILDNPSAEPLVVFEETVEFPEIPWMRLRFGETQLMGDSYLILQSAQDGAIQVLDNVALSQWGRSSAYFNGSAITVTLVAGGHTVGNQVTIDSIVAGEWGGAVIPESQCGPTDDRVSSDEPERGRLLGIGCTVSIYTPESCFITAGHCLAFLANVVEFNVPPSLPDGTLQHPAPEDQYSVDSASREFTDGGVGNDWGLFKVFPNSTTGMMPFEAQGAMVELDIVLPELPETIDLVGYGIDGGVDNQVQQRSTGPITSISGGGNFPTVNHQADTEGGNSGSAIIADSAGKVVAIHTHAGCTTGGSGSNASTGITHPGLQAALVDYCVEAPPISCDDIQKFKALCSDNQLRAGVRLIDSSHSGQTVTLSIDGVPVDVAVIGNKAVFKQSDTTGTVTVALESPAGCFDPVDVTCD